MSESQPEGVIDINKERMESTTPPMGRKSKDVPFYQTPEHVRTSAQIIKDAKDSLSRPYLRSLQTRRPETPQDGQRKLFGEQSTRDPTTRPPSAFSLGSRHFDSESRPVSGTRLMPLDVQQRPKGQTEAEGPVAPKPPADPNRPLRRTSSRQRLQQQLSVEAAQQLAPSSPGSETLPRSKSGSFSDVVSAASPSSSKPTSPEYPRRVHSGPKERSRATELRLEPEPPPSRPDSGKRRRSRDRQNGEHVETGYTSDTTRENSAGSQRGSSAGSQRGSSAGNKPGSAGRREEQQSDDAFYNDKIAPLVEEMASYIKDKDPEKLSSLADTLYQVLDEGNRLGKGCKQRPAILKTVFKLLDLESPKLLLRLARLILALKVSGNNLVNVCKLVFKVSREEKNDSFFLEGNIIDLLIETAKTADHVASAEALVYCIGALKFLSGNTTALRYLVKRHCYESLAKVLVSINQASAESSKPPEQLGNILVQLTATLRNLSDVSGSKSYFLSLNLVKELCRVMQVYQHDADLMLNVARIFSKVTMHADCCTAVSSQSNHFRLFLQLLTKYQKREDLVLRISFILGNLTAKSDQARRRLFEQPKAMDTLMTLLKTYCEIDLKTSRDGDAKGDSSDARSSKVEDVLVKVIRLVANLSISEEIGGVIATSDTCVTLLIQVLENKRLHTSEELVLNTMATINNLSYYNEKNSAITRKQIRLSESLLKFMDIRHLEGLAEATRVFGNLSRERCVRDLLVKHKVDEYIVTMLDSGNTELVFTACGVLINLMADEEKRPTLQRLGGISKLVEVLRDCGRDDWTLACMVCQTLWNYSGKITSANAFFGEAESQDLIETLEDYMDEDTALGEAENGEEIRDHIFDQWQTQFCPVASQLLERIEQHSSHFEPLEPPS